VTRQLAAVAFLGALAVALGCRREAGPKGESPPPPIVVISVDTLRSDRLPAYGYTAVATPAIDALRAGAVLYRRAYSHAPLTLPSHASLFTGLLPSAHGVRDNVGYTLDAKRHPSLPVLLRQRGYTTGAAVSAFVLRSETGIGEGFDHYDDTIQTRVGRGLSGLQRTGTETVARALSWVDGAGERPFFLFVHLYEPHAPYAAPEPFRSRYELAYDAEVAAADAAVGELLDGLRARGIYDRALVVLLSDHGEGLGEHGEDGHGVFLYRHDLQVPLIVKLPARGSARGVVDSPVGLTDVFPTLLVHAGVPVPAGGPPALPLPGDPAFPATRRGLYAETFTPRLHFGWSELTSWIDGDLHYVHGPDPELFDLARDPGETRSIFRERRRAATDMRAALARESAPLAPPAAVDRETRKALAALGYVGQASLEATGPLPDPKAMLPTLAHLHQGLELYARDRPAEAAAALRQAVADNPRMVDGWDYLGRSYQKLRQHERALEAFREAMRLSGGLPEVALATAMSLVEVGRPDEALLVLRHQLERSPEELRLAFVEVRVLLAQGRLDEAERRADEVLARAPDDADAVYQRGTVRMARRDLGGAERDLRRALALAPDHPAALSDLAVLLQAVGRKHEALALLDRLAVQRPADEQLRLRRQRLRDEVAG
jgi:arylsulfatase A-like enzyme/Tfp pilus assembly protein PilF